MFLTQYLRIIWARKWIVITLFVLIAAAGITTVMMLPRQYTAETSLVVEVRIDPALGALAPERYFAGVLQRGLSVEPGRGSSIINMSFTAGDPVFAQAAANAFAQAYQDVSVELRVAPARQSATFLDEQVKSLRADLENAQSRLSTTASPFALKRKSVS